MVDSPLNTGPTGILPSLTNTNFQQMESKVLTGIYSRSSNVRQCSLFSEEMFGVRMFADFQMFGCSMFSNAHNAHNVRTLEFSKYECSLLLKCSNVR